MGFLVVVVVLYLDAGAWCCSYCCFFGSGFDFYFGFWFWLLFWFSVVVDVCMVAKPH